MSSASASGRPGGGGSRGAGAREGVGRDLTTEIFLYLCSAVVSVGVMSFAFSRLDPTRKDAKKNAERKKALMARLGRPNVQTTQYEDIIASDVLNPQHINVRFSSIGGLEEQKDALHELVILPLLRPELFAHSRLLQPVKGILLYGPPGTGKTMLAKAIAKESGAVFINVKMSSLQSKWFGEAQKLVHALFSLAYKLQPSIVFIDEVDSFLGERTQGEHEAFQNMKTEFMTMWDGITTDEGGRVVVLAATNRPWEVDKAILRRLPRSFLVGLPDTNQREHIIRTILFGTNINHQKMNIRDLAKRTEGYTGSDIKELCKAAAYEPVRDLIKEERKRGAGSFPGRLPGADGGDTAPPAPRGLEFKDFETAMEQVRPNGEIANFYRVASERQDARGVQSAESFMAMAREARMMDSSPGAPSQDAMRELLEMMRLAQQQSNGNGRGT